MVKMQTLLLSCLVVIVTSRQQFQDKYNLVWELESAKMDYDNKFKDFESQYNLERKFEKLEQELEMLSEQPFFARVNNRTVVGVGEVAYLPCRVKFIQQGYMVTWLRTSDSTVLSVGADTFSSDARLSVVHVNRPQINADDWTLIINKTGLGDGGRYECSVNTLPKISHSVDLVVEDTEMALQDSPDIPVMEDYVMDTTWTQHNLRATIQGPKTQYVSEGSTVALQCSIPHVHTPPSSLYWTRNGKMFNAKDRPGISLESEKVVKVSTSKLFISHVSLADSANYSCVSDISKPDSVQLVVTQALPGYALMFHNSSSGHLIKSQQTFLELSLLSFICILSVIF